MVLVSQKKAGVAALIGACMLSVMTAGVSFAQTNDSAVSRDLLAKQQVRLDRAEADIRAMRGMLETDLRNVKQQLENLSSSALAGQTAKSAESKELASKIAELTDSIDILDQRIKRTIEMSSDIEFRVLRLEKRMQALLSLNAGADIQNQIVQDDTTGIGNAPSIQMNRNLETGETVWTVDQNDLAQDNQSLTASQDNASDNADMTQAEQVSSTATQTDNLSQEAAGETVADATEQAEVSQEPTRNVLPDTSPEEQYRFALGRALQNDLATAEQAFAEFLELHPEDERTADSHYWLGRVQFLQGQYAKAVTTFTEFNASYPEDSRLVDTTLLIAESVGQFATTEQACAIYRDLPQYLDSPPDFFLKRVAELSSSASCN